MPVWIERKHCTRKWRENVMLVKKGRRRVPENYIEYQVPFKQVKEQEDGTLLIEWYGSTPELDSYNDVVLASAFEKDIALSRYHDNPVILRGHDDEKIIWVMLEDKVDKGGRWVKAHLKYDTDNTFDMIKDGVVKGYSIGFIPRDYEYLHIDWRALDEISDEEWETINIWTDIKRVIKELEIFELSVVNLPANPATLFTMSKAVKSYFTDLIPKDMKLSKAELLELKNKALNGEALTDEEQDALDNVETPEVEETEEKSTETKDEPVEEVSDDEDDETDEVEETDTEDTDVSDDEEAETEEEDGEDEEDEEDTDWDELEDSSETDETSEEEDEAQEAEEDEEKSAVFGLKEIKTLQSEQKAMSEKMTAIEEKNVALQDLVEKLFGAYEELAEEHLALSGKFNAMPRKTAMIYTGKSVEKGDKATLRNSMQEAREKAVS